MAPIESSINQAFIHSFRPFLKRPFKSSTTQRHSRLQHGYYIGVSRRSAQATAGKGLAQSPYMAVRAGVEPTTLRLRVIASTNAPPCPILKRLVQWPSGPKAEIRLYDLFKTALVVIYITNLYRRKSSTFNSAQRRN